ncbi:hypothetical protein GCM10027065_00680 [Rhodanobacter koreensis]
MNAAPTFVHRGSPRTTRAGATAVAMLAAIDGWFEAKSVRSPLATELLSLCVAKEKVTKEKGHPAWRSPGILPGECVRRGRVFRQDSCPDEKGSTSMSIPLRACRPRPTAAQGPRVEQRASCAHFRKSQIKSSALQICVRPGGSHDA